MHLARIVILVSCTCSTACATAVVRPALTTSRPAADAVLVLPGLGYGHRGNDVFKALAPSLAAEGMDLYVPTFVARSGLSESRERLQRFIRESRLNRYERVHVFAFIAGGWVLNSLGDADAIPNLATVVYDRSPYQERAPQVARDKLRFLTWVRYGSVVSDLARTPYTPLTTSNVRVGIVVETVPTRFIRRFAASARRYGPIRFECEALTQPYDDCVYVALNHQDLYTHFAEVWPEVGAFIRTGRFTSSAEHAAPLPDLVVRGRRR